METPTSQNKPSEFPEISRQEVLDVLGLTIKGDDVNKYITFLAMLSTYTEESQLNIAFSSPSSTGKTYISTEIAKLFPQEDVLTYAYSSPTSFYHQDGEYDKENKVKRIDLSRKILNFLDQPHTELLSRLRPLLSKDKKELPITITNKTRDKGLKTNNILLIGYPSVVFCSTSMTIDEQEATRFILLSPEISQDKLRESIKESITRNSNPEAYRKALEENPERRSLKNRVLAIRNRTIRGIIMEPEDEDQIYERFLSKGSILAPRNLRESSKIMSLIRAHALLNIWNRKQENRNVYINQTDIDEGFKLWHEVSKAQRYGISPSTLYIYESVILPIAKAKGWPDKPSAGVYRTEIIKKYRKTSGSHMTDVTLSKQVLPMLVGAGLIELGNDPKDRRVDLIYPTKELVKGGKEEPMN